MKYKLGCKVHPACFSGTLSLGVRDIWRFKGQYYSEMDLSFCYVHSHKLTVPQPRALGLQRLDMYDMLMSSCKVWHNIS